MQEQLTATYSPEDNKLRLYSASKLDAELYTQVKTLGFKYAPKQGFFVAPMWTPSREDFLNKLCGEIGDEDTSLIERSEERAERFEGYQESRAGDAERASDRVAAICEHIPFGQPILVGHHSEKRARKQAQTIENGTRYAVKMWETSEYWKRRAAGAIRAAKYKERPDVRARRIKTLIAAKRKQERNKKDAVTELDGWNAIEVISYEAALQIANYSSYNSQCFTLEKYPRELPASQYEGQMSIYSALTGGIVTAEQARDCRRPRLIHAIAHYERWINHYANRIEYETAMLDEQGAIELIAKKERPKPLPICNYMQAVGFDVESRWNPGTIDHYQQVVMTKAEYSKLHTDYRGTLTIGNSHRIRLALVPRGEGETGYGRKRAAVFISDTKVTEPPAAIEAKPRELPPPPKYRPAPEPTEQELKFKALKEQARAGVKVIVANQLFPTSPELAARMVDMADIQEGETVLEPSAGTGAILQAIMNNDTALAVVAVEINQALADNLANEYPLSHVHGIDFLTYERGRCKFDKIIMNPPFENAADIKHIKHALTMLKPGGMLVAICANGSRQNAQLQHIAEYWEPLPAGTFAHAGTGVSTVLLTIKG